MDSECPNPGTTTKLVRTNISRSRGGCRTCKSRRVKCDETRLNCRRCTNAGRSCGGYLQEEYISKKAARLVFVKPSTLSSFRPSSIIIEDPYDGHYMNLFRHRIAGNISGYSSPEVWTAMMLQAVYEESAVRHAAIAFSALLSASSPGSWSPGTPIFTTESTYPLRHYTKAISSLKELLPRNDSHSRTAALLCSLLCICFETLNHLNGVPNLALTILEGTLQFAQQGPVDDDVLQAFTRLDIQASSYIGTRPPAFVFSDNDIQIPHIFHSLREAENSFRIIQNRLYHFIRSTAAQYRHFNTCSPPVPLEVYAEAQSIQHHLLNWDSCFGSSLQQSTILLTTKTASQIYILQIHHIVATIQIATSLYVEETLYDKFDAHFVRIVALSEKLRSSSDFYPEYSSENEPIPFSTPEIYFSVDIGIVQPLYLTATKCRVDAIRSRAISLLHDFPRQEGVWNAALMAKIAERIKQVEEEMTFTLPDVGLPFVGKGDKNARIPEWRRVHSVVREVGEGSKIPEWKRVHAIVRQASEGKVIPEWERLHDIMKEGYDRDRFVVIGCRMLRNGADGGWYDRVEVVTW